MSSPVIFQLETEEALRRLVGATAMAPMYNRIDARFAAMAEADLTGGTTFHALVAAFRRALGDPG